MLPIAGIMLALTGCAGAAESEPARAESSSTTATVDRADLTDAPVDPGEVIAQQLQAGLADDPAAVMSSEAEFTEQQAREGLPAGSEVEVHADSWSPVGAGRSGVVTITVTQPSGVEGSFAAVVQLEGEAWKILSTFPLEGE